MFVRISKLKKKSEIIFLLKILDFDRVFRKTYDRLKNINYINKKAAVLMREDKKFTTKNKIFRKEIKNLRKIIFEEKCKRKRGKVLNFYKKDKMKIRFYFSVPRKLLGRENVQPR
jgi:hypothetical protein